MVHQVVTVGLHVRLVVKDAVLLRSTLAVLGRAGEANHFRVERLHVLAYLLHSVALGVNGDEDGNELIRIASSALLRHVNSLRRLGELVGADVGAVGEAKIEQSEFSLEFFTAHYAAVGVNKLEWATNGWGAD